jgi:thiamine-monophosphate kinase
VSPETEILEKIRDRAPIPRGSELVRGIGDDCAIFRPRGAREDLVFTTDMLLEGVHFRPETHRAEDIGHKALARSLSDIAAMGGEPRFCLLSLALAPWSDRRWLDAFYRGFLKLAKTTGTLLAGGDLARGGQVFCDVMVCGAAPAGSALRRDGARPGDGIYVSGRLGGSALGLAGGKGQAGRRHLRPQPRLRLGRFLRAKLHATAAMDISDGLSIDLRRMCLASGVAAAIVTPPLYPGATPAQALHGGEDYELLFTLAGKAKPPVGFEGLPLTRIGTIHKGRPGDVLLDGRPLAPLGYDHFRDA